MNYLAHLFLSFELPDIMLGNFIADTIRPSSYRSLPTEVRKGVLLHRAIDQFTDAHSGFKHAVDIYKKRHPRYAPVIVDIVNDHLLAQSWDKYAMDSLDVFELFVYDSFKGWPEKLSGRSSRHVSALLEHQYLSAYKPIEGLSRVLQIMDKRTRFPSNFSGAIMTLEQYDSELIKAFDSLMSDLIAQLPEMMNEATIQMADEA